MVGPTPDAELVDLLGFVANLSGRGLDRETRSRQT